MATYLEFTDTIEPEHRCLGMTKINGLDGIQVKISRQHYKMILSMQMHIEQFSTSQL